jgi:hypothetical protein
MTGRLLAAHIYDLLANDACLPPYLDEDDTIVHGTGKPCGQPFETHSLPMIRREEQPWPADFCRAVVTMGKWSRSQIGFGQDRASWTFVIGIFTRSTVIDTLGVISQGQEVGGDLWAFEIYDHVIRILGQRSSASRFGCPSDILIGDMHQESDVSPIGFQEGLRAWRILTRFRWLVISRGTRVAAPACCDEPVVV